MAHRLPIMLHMRKWLGVGGALAGAAAVIAGAVGAHALQLEAGSVLARRYDTAVTYLLAHAVVVALGHWCRPRRAFWWDVARAVMLLGTVLFSGGLLVAVSTGWRVPFIPFGGMCLIAGWLVAAFAAASSTEGGWTATEEEKT